MRDENRLRVAIQKSGRLAEKSIALFAKCGLDFDLRKDRLLHQCKDFPIDLMMVRDDDIPEYVNDGVCDLGVAGDNIIRERIVWSINRNEPGIKNLMSLGFGACRLSLAVPEDSNFESLQSFTGKRIATSYPNSLKHFFNELGIAINIVELSGSVEIATGLDIADAVCDLVSTGGTLQSNGLREFKVLLESQAVLFRTNQPMSPSREFNLDRLLKRVQGVISAVNAKYIMMNAPIGSIDQIRKIIPGLEEPSIVPLGKDGTKVAIHAVAREDIFWETLESLKAVGASSILVLPIEKVLQ